MSKPLASRRNNPRVRVKSGAGFTLLEVTIAIGLLAATTVVFLGIWLTTIVGVRIQRVIVASHIAARKIESLRQTEFDSLPSSGQFYDPALADLPDGAAYLDIDDYLGTSSIKHVIVTVTWMDAGTTKNYRLDTLIARGVTNPP